MLALPPKHRIPCGFRADGGILHHGCLAFYRVVEIFAYFSNLLFENCAPLTPPRSARLSGGLTSRSHCGTAHSGWHPAGRGLARSVAVAKTAVRRGRQWGETGRSGRIWPGGGGRLRFQGDPTDQLAHQQLPIPGGFVVVHDAWPNAPGQAGLGGRFGEGEGFFGIPQRGPGGLHFRR